MTREELNAQTKAALDRHNRRELARQRKAEGREYMSIILGDIKYVIKA